MIFIHSVTITNPSGENRVSVVLRSDSETEITLSVEDLRGLAINSARLLDQIEHQEQVGEPDADLLGYLKPYLMHVGHSMECIEHVRNEDNEQIVITYNRKKTT